MRERELPEGVEQTPQPAISPEMHRQRFEELAGAFTRDEFDRLNEDGSVTKIVSYERDIDPLDRGHLSLVREFRLRAAASGLREAFSAGIAYTVQLRAWTLGGNPVTRAATSGAYFRSVRLREAGGNQASPSLG
jgi:hypothetical protein